MSSLNIDAFEHKTEGLERGFPFIFNSTPMKELIPSPYIEVGIDLSKDKLDVAFDGKMISVSNDTKGIHSLFLKLSYLQESYRLNCEATGPYSRILVGECLKSKIPISIVNPCSVRNFARASGQVAKTDKIDALLIARYAKTFNPELVGDTWFQKIRLSQFLQRIDFLTATRARCKASLDSYNDPEILKEIRREICALDKRIETYQAKIDREISQNKELNERREKLKEIKGVGENTSTTLIITVPELGSMNRKEVAALFGLAPMNKDSGRVTGKRMIKHGRSRPRRALYMAALSACRHHPSLSQYYKKIRENGKPAKVALVAIARKLAIMLNTSLKIPSQT